MKDYQKLLQKKYLKVILLGITIISLTFSPALAAPKVTTQLESKPLQLETFIDRKTLNTNEEIRIKVWIDSDSKQIDNATVNVIFPENKLELMEDLSCQDGIKKHFSCQVKLPRVNAVNFTFTGRKNGKFSVLVQVSGQDKKTNKEITERQQIQDIEVKNQAQWWSKLLSSPLLGVFIGGVLTIGTTAFTNWLQSRWAKRQRRQWIISNLPAQLEVTHQAICQGRETGFELWMDKLRNEGYYTELQQFARKKTGQENLPERLLSIAFRLRDYERDRQGTLRNIKENYQEIADDLDQIIQVFRDS